MTATSVPRPRRSWPIAGVLTLLLAAAGTAADAAEGTEAGSEEGREARPSGKLGTHRGRYFLWTELNLVGYYSSDSGQVDSTPRPQRSSIGLELAGVLEREHRLRRIFGDGVEGVRFDLHPLAIYDPLEDQFEVVFQDAWLQLDFGGRHERKLRLGQFLVPFGQNPVLEPRGFFILPLTSADLGFKRDWGLSFQTKAGSNDLELGLTTGSGLALHRGRDSFLLSGRFGTPTYRDLQLGFSALYGKVPEIMAEEVMPGPSVRRWRTSGDLIYMLDTRTLIKAELALGRDGAVPVGGYKVDVDYVPERLQDLELEAQLMSWFNDLDRSGSDDSALTLGLSYSLTTSLTLGAYYVHDLRSLRRPEDDRIFVQVYFYARSHAVGH